MTRSIFIVRDAKDETVVVKTTTPDLAIQKAIGFTTLYYPITIDKLHVDIE